TIASQFACSQTMSYASHDEPSGGETIEGAAVAFPARLFVFAVAVLAGVTARRRLQEVEGLVPSLGHTSERTFSKISIDPGAEAGGVIDCRGYQSAALVASSQGSCRSIP